MTGKDPLRGRLAVAAVTGLSVAVIGASTAEAGA